MECKTTPELSTNTQSPQSTIQNYIRLQYLVNTTGNEFLRQCFCQMWTTVENTQWENTQEYGTRFIEGHGKKLFDKSQKIQMAVLKTGNINMWDLSLLIESIKCLNVPSSIIKSSNKFATFPSSKNFKQLDSLKEIRNKLAHAGTVEIDGKTFENHWEKASSILLSLGVSQEQIDKVRILKLQEDAVPDAETLVNDANKKIAEELKDQGNALFKSKKFAKAIEIYTNAIFLPNLPTAELAVLYSNRSIAFLKSEDFQQAEDDAKSVVALRPMWWRGYIRLANAYAQLKKFKEALKYSEIAVGMQPNNKEAEDTRDYCRLMVAKLAREEHMDPINFVDTYKEQEERMKQLGMDVDFSKFSVEHPPNELTYKLGLPFGICGEGHKYLHGMGVPQNYELAAKMFSKAAGKDNAEGMYNLAMLTQEGKGVARNISQAMELLRKAAAQDPIIEAVGGYDFKVPNIGVLEAQHALGLSYDEGVGVPKDYQQALVWYTKALENGSGNSANNIGFMYAGGKGVRRDLKTALLYWKLGSFLGTVRAMECMAIELWKLGEWKSAQEWCTYALENGSVMLKISQDQFMIGRKPLEGFDREKFKKALEEELLQSPLKHLARPIKHGYADMCKQMNEHSKPLITFDPLSNEYKRQIILIHRKSLKEMNKRGQKHVCNTTPAKLKQKDMIDFVGLKPISIRDMDVKKDHIYEGFLLKLTIIEDAILGRPSVGLIGQDENGDVQRVFVYNHPQNKETQDVLGYGCRISIVNPYFRIAADNLQAIRIDDPSTIIPHAKLTDKNRCRFCGQEKAKLVCRKCRRVYYCSNQCLKKDSEDMQHDLICMKRVM